MRRGTAASASYNEPHARPALDPREPRRLRPRPRAARPGAAVGRDPRARPRWRAAQTGAEQLQAERNRLAKEIGAAKAQGRRRRRRSCARSPRARSDEARLEAEAARTPRERSTRRWRPLPNLPADDVPDGIDETANRLVRQHGTPPPSPFAAKDHVALGEGLGMMDFERAGKLSGARFVVLQRRAGAAGARARAVHARSAHARVRLYRGRAAAAGARRGRVRHRPAAEIRRGPVPHHDRPLADPDRRGAADQPRRRRDPRRGGAAAALHRLARRASAPRRARRARTRAA